MENNKNNASVNATKDKKESLIVILVGEMVNVLFGIVKGFCTLVCVLVVAALIGNTLKAACGRVIEPFFVLGYIFVKQADKAMDIAIQMAKVAETQTAKETETKTETETETPVLPQEK
jgi:hypothetical protein